MTVDELRRHRAVKAADWTSAQWTMVVEHLAHRSVLDVLRDPSAPLQDDQVASILACADRVRLGEPLAYVLGLTYFDGLLLQVTPETLIPRPDTEVLVRAGLSRLSSAAPEILDLGTGSGAVALAVKAACPQASVTGSDVSPGCLAVAKRNADRLGLVVRWIEADLLDGLGHFDMILSNPPYIAEGDPRVDPSVLAFEPERALFAGPDGLACIEPLVRTAPAHLHAGGLLCIEHGPEQHPLIRALGHAAGFVGVECIDDFAGRARVTCMRRPDGGND